MDWLKRYVSKCRANVAFLRRISDEVGKGVEQWPYEKLSRPAEEISFSRVINGIEVSFSIEEFNENKAGDLHICMDVNAKIPTFLFGLPSYVFWKRRDGSVDYGP
jgi:hypothetical protein